MHVCVRLGRGNRSCTDVFMACPFMCCVPLLCGILCLLATSRNWIRPCDHHFPSLPRVFWISRALLLRIVEAAEIRFLHTRLFPWKDVKAPPGIDCPRPVCNCNWKMQHSRPRYLPSEWQMFTVSRMQLTPWSIKLMHCLLAEEIFVQTPTFLHRNPIPRRKICG